MTNGHSSMDIDENDELLYEIDVKLNRTKQPIYLFQYPIRPFYRKYDEASFTSARIKEKHSLVEMDLYIDRQSSNYSAAKGKQFAESTNSDKNQFFNSDHMDKQTIASSHAIDGDSYFIGLFDSATRDFILCPVKSIIQLRPQFNYLDTTLTSAIGAGSALTKETSLFDDDLAGASDGEQSGSETEENKPEPLGSLVTMKFEKKESEYHRKKHLQSYNYYRQTRDNDRWKDFECVINAHSSDAQRIREQFLSINNQLTTATTTTMN